MNIIKPLSPRRETGRSAELCSRRSQLFWVNFLIKSLLIKTTPLSSSEADVCVQRRPGGKARRGGVQIMKESTLDPVVSSCNCSWFLLCVSRLTRVGYEDVLAPPHQRQQSSLINKLRIFFALICLEAFFFVSAETCLAMTAPLLPDLIGLEGSWE